MIREFYAPEGVRWKAWAVRPGVASDTAPDHSPTLMQWGWLCFENAAGEKRRFAPLPAGWTGYTDGELARLLGVAELARDREPGANAAS
jgi:hypothetical protein